jgi:hypothetical protein
MNANLIRRAGCLGSIETELNGIRCSWRRLPEEQWRRLPEEQGRQGDWKAVVARDGDVDSEGEET